MNLGPGTELGSYEILSTLGAGGMGEVYRARDRRLNRSVALKLLPPDVAADAERRGRFRREAHLLASLNHPNIAQVYGFEDPAARDQPAALVMELVEGQTLAERIVSGPLPLEQARAIATQIADAIAYAHAHGVIHRDLKPANIKLRPDGTVKVLDFGLAKAIETSARTDAEDSATVAHGHTEPGVVMGTAAYMSPEQVRGLPVDQRSDVWSFGAVLFEMLTGRPAFPGPSATDVMAAVARDEPQWSALPPSTPPLVRVALELCLARDLRHRLRDVGDASLLLTSTGADTPSRGAAAAARSRPAATALLLAVGLAALAALGAVWMRPTPPADTPIRFTLPQSPAASLNQQFITSPLAVSPDGRTIVTATPEGLVLWTADTGGSRLVADTAGAVAPFFSPDSADLAFFARDELRRVAVAGGPSHLIAPVANANAGTWGSRNTILVTRWLGPDIGLWEIPAQGGTPRELVRAAAFTDLQAFPSFLPDGRHYVFVQGNFGAPVGKRRICIGQVDGGAPACVADGDSNPAYSATGHLVFIRGGALVALPFDADRRQVRGAAITLAPDIRWFGPVGMGAFAVSANGRLLVHALRAAPRRLHWTDRGGTHLGDLAEPRLYNHALLSPDGSRVAVDIWSAETGGRDLWVIDVASSDLRRVTFDTIDTFLGAWSEDGQSLLFGAPAAGPPDVYEIAADGGTPRPLLVRPGVQLPQDRSPGTGWLAYLEVFANRDARQLWLVPPGGEPRPLRNTTADTWDARFSPDGRQLAYVSNESGTPEVYVMAFAEGGTPRRVSRGNGFMPRWRGDGRELFYLRTDGMLMAVDLGRDGLDHQPLFRIDGVTAEDAPTPPRERSATFDVTRDGRRFLLRTVVPPTDRSDDLRVWVNWASALR